MADLIGRSAERESQQADAEDEAYEPPVVTDIDTTNEPAVTAHAAIPKSGQLIAAPQAL